jgi:hypothetical protein
LAQHHFRCMMARRSQKTKTSSSCLSTTVQTFLVSQRHRNFLLRNPRITTSVFSTRNLCSLGCKTILLSSGETSPWLHSWCVWYPRDARRHTITDFGLAGPFCRVSLRLNGHHPPEAGCHSTISCWNHAIWGESFCIPGT